MVEPQGCQARRCAGLLFRLFHRSYNRHRDWEVEEQPGHGVWRFIRSYVVSLAAVLALGFLLLVSLVVTAGLAAIGKFAAPYMQEWVLHLLSILVSLSVISLLFAMMFKWLPDAEVNWYDVWLGAVITAVFFEIGKAAIGFYIGKQGLESTYGAAASIIVVLIWVYYTIPDHSHGC